MTNQSIALSEKIAGLKNQKTKELDFLREQFYETFERLKPINLIKDTFI